MANLALAFVLAAARFAAAQEEAQVPPAEGEGPPRLIIRGFGNVDFETRRDDVPETFALGEMDLLLTSSISDVVSVLAEVVFEPGEGEEQLIDVERFQVKLAFSDRFNLTLGRMHTVLGFWNQTYHHGAWFQTTIFRPEIYRFEDHGGLLPVHEVGLEASGTQDLSTLHLDYSLSVANGRGRVPSEILLAQDANREKAVNLWLGLRLSRVPGLLFGGVAHFDTIPPEPSVRGDPLRERIYGGFVAYTGRRGELLAEAFRIDHEDEVTGESFRSTGLYAQAAFRLGRWKPYYRYDRVDAAAGDPYYVGDDFADTEKHSLGTRIDPWTWATVKVEGSRQRRDSSSPFFAGAVQFALTF